MDPAAYVEMDAIEARHWWFRGKRRLVAPLIARLCARSSAPRIEQQNHAQLDDRGHSASSSDCREHVDPDPTAQTRPRGTYILEIGCGTGGNLAHFAPRFPEATFIGLDFDTEATRFSANKSDGAFAVLQGDGLRLPFASDSLDGALALDIIEHFEDDAALCRELARVLKPGSDLVLSVPAWPSLWSPHDDFLHHKSRYTPAELRRLIEAAGLEIQETRGFNFLLLPPIWLVRRLKRKSAKTQPEAPAGTDFFDLPRPLEAALASLFVLEAALVRLLPIHAGVSIMLRARKPPQYGDGHVAAIR